MVINKRREIIFLYDVRDSNPNGDPDDGNRPRMDVDGYNIVTDVRLKRTIRDYWLKKYQGQAGKHVLIRRELHPESGDLQSMEDLVLQALNIDKTKLSDKKNIKYRKEAIIKIANDLPKEHIDVRAFGGAITVKNANYSHTGAVQFAIGKSLNKPTVNDYTITTTFASGEEKGAGTFGEFFVVDYSLLKFHGIICEHTAQQTGFNKDDLHLLYEGLWNGTKMLNTRSKFNHSPRLLLSVVSKEKTFQVGDLDQSLSLMEEEDIKDISQIKINITSLVNSLTNYANRIEKIELVSNEAVTYVSNSKETNNITELLSTTGIPIEEIKLE